MTLITRFAPSPTGLLHVGNVRTALMTWLFARKEGGQFILRIDDTDAERSKDEYEDAIERDLAWLGLDWDRKENQKNRWDRYNQCIEDLKNAGRIYPCYETEEELGLKRKNLLSRGLPPIYDRAALKLSDDDRKKYESEGRTPHWRFQLNDDEMMEWTDLVRGEISFHPKDMSDPVVIRENGVPLYHLCSVIDDIDFEVTHITRGEDHVSNTALHVQMFTSLGAQVPDFIHLPLITGKDGDKLSKRIGSLGIQDLREQEKLDPMAFNCLMARLGTSQPIEVFQELKPLIEQFDFDHFSRNSPKFDIEDLHRLNARILHEKSFKDVQAKLAELGLDQIDEGFWLTVRENIDRLEDVKTWYQVARGPVTPVIEDHAYIELAAKHLPDGNWTEVTWGQWTNTLKEATGRKGKALFMPLRQALTGLAHGPEMPKILPLIGYDRTLERLQVKKS